MTRPSTILIDLDALRGNYRVARRLHGSRALAVIKANAYGHGAIACAKALVAETDGFAVAFVDEAYTLRESGIRHPILVLEGALSAAELHLADELDLSLVVHDESQLRMLEMTDIPPHSLDVWLKIDTGMRRVGFECADAPRAFQRLLETGKVRSIVLMTHFARADNPSDSMTAEQIERFDEATKDLPGPRSLCNSAGVMCWPKARRDWARPGLMLYGIPPCGETLPGLAPVMTFSSQVFAVRTLKPGDSIGYGATFVAKRHMRVGLVCVGYADGYPQTAPSGTPVAIDSERTTLVGRVSMDMLAVDLTDLPRAGMGSEVELWGQTVRVAEVARAANRIPYELVCSVKRVPLFYRDSKANGTKPSEFSLSMRHLLCS
jgi:alanine racemase